MLFTFTSPLEISSRQAGYLVYDDILQREANRRRNVSDQDHLAVQLDGLDAQFGGALNSGSVDCNICAAGYASDLLQRIGVAGVYAAGSAVFPGQRQAAVVNINGDNLGSAKTSYHLQGQQTDGADAHDDNAVAGTDLGSGCCVIGDGERFHHGRLDKGDIVRYAVEYVFRNADILGKAAAAVILFAGYAEHLSVCAEVYLAFAAHGAVIAIHGGIECHPVSDGEVPNILAAGSDHACRLMPHDDGRAAAAGASVKAVHIASADGTRLNPYQNLVGLNGRVCDVLVS